MLLKPLPFIITCAARTGSTMLRYMLDNHPQIICRGELFNRRNNIGFWNQYKRHYKLASNYEELVKSFNKKSIANFVQEDIFTSKQSNIQAIGFKFKTDEYFDKNFVSIAATIKKTKNIKVIHLRRNDLLAQYVSHKNVTNAGTVVFKNQEEKIHSCMIKKAELFSFLDDVTMRENKIQHELRDHDILNITYEDLLRNTDGLTAIQSFLKVETMILKPETKKIISNYHLYIKNISEVLKWMSESQYRNRINL